MRRAVGLLGASRIHLSGRRWSPLLSALLGSWLLVLISPTLAEAGCGDYLWQLGRPMVLGHALSWPTWQPPGPTIDHSPLGLGLATLPAEHERLPCVTGTCDGRRSSPFPTLPSISLRSLDPGLLSPQGLTLDAPGGSARDDGDSRVMAITHSFPPDRPPRS